MRHTASPLPFAAAPLSPEHASFLGRARAAVVDVHQSGPGTVALLTLVGAATVFLVSSLWRMRPDPSGGRRQAAVRLGLQIVGLGGVFVALACLVVDGVWLNSVDSAVLDWFTDHRSEWLTGPAILITDVAGPVGTVLAAVLIGVGFSWRARSPIPALILIGAVGSAAAASTATKLLVGRSRPPIVSQVLLETDYSFPSGHATGATALFLTAAVLAGSSLSRGRRRLLFLAACAASAVVAITRLYLGEHWFSDVVGGVILGGLAALIGAAVHAAWYGRTHEGAATGESGRSEVPATIRAEA